MRQSRAKIITATATLVLTLSACGEGSAFDDEFNKSWSDEFTKTCVAEAVKVGAPEADAQPACECVTKELATSLDGMTEKLNPPQEKMNAALRACDIPV